MRQQVLSPDNTLALSGKKSVSKASKGEDFGENGRRVVGDGPSLDDEKPVLKMPGGRLKGSSTYHNKEQKVNKDHKDRKDDKDNKEHIDHNKVEEDTEIKAAGPTEGMEDDAEGHNRRGQDGETLLQWGQRKRPRYREPSGLLKTSIRVDRRVVRADKIAVQQFRGSILRPSNVILEAASGTSKRAADVSGTAVPHTENDHIQSSSGHRPLSGDQEEFVQQHPVFPYIRENVPACNSGGHIVATAFALRRVDTESSQEKSVAVEKMNLELFEWPKIMISLTRKEKEDDFTAIKGTKLPQRPKRRPKTVEKNVQFISPGTWLCDLTRERYEVREKKTVKKKPRGLKAMGSVDSDSE